MSKSKINGKPRFNFREIKRILKINGYRKERQGAGNHIIYKNINTGKSIPIPKKSGIYPEGTVVAIARQMGLSVKDFYQIKYKKILSK